MSTTATFDLDTDDPELRLLVDDAKAQHDPVLTWTIAVFVCSLMRDRALKAQGVREYHDRLKARRAETRAAALSQSGQPTKGASE